MSENISTICETFPLIGDSAPRFKALTTNGETNFPDDYAGRWVVFFSHPMDFTPVCTTEFLAFQAAYEEFRRLNTDIPIALTHANAHNYWRVFR